MASYYKFCLALIGCVIVLAGQGCSSYNHEVSGSKRLGGKALEFADAGNSLIRISGADVEECEVRAMLTIVAQDNEKAEELAARTEVSFNELDDRFSVSAETQGMFGRAVKEIAYYVKVPIQSDVIVETSNGHIYISDVNGKIDCKSKNGGITLERTNGVIRLSTSSGYVTCRQIEGDAAAIASTSGKVSIGGATFDELKIRTANGMIDGNELSCCADFETVNAGVYIKDSWLKDKSKVATSSGHVSCINVKGEVDVDTRKGSVSMLKASGIAGRSACSPD